MFLELGPVVYVDVYNQMYIRARMAVITLLYKALRVPDGSSIGLHLRRSLPLRAPARY